ncbi:MAG: type II secretion system protein GspL [Desulfuromonadaceae bacterium]|nr:type II secretion system protein GspL [Desulfuromonadaceae bacterium]MDD2849832.1 type II secretion system protein GspL [Desulfuromonadaceae bacterium]MDD4131603.1 type II secretion system protein GspL [Desulfuromonadaceae bacterium]
MDYLILQAEEKLLTVARFGVSRRSAELIAAASIVLNEERPLADAVRNVAENLTGSPRVVLCLTPALFAQRTITLPFNDVRKVKAVLPSQLQGDIALPVEELALGILPEEEGAFLALWTRKSDIGAAIIPFREGGIEPQVVSSLPFALADLPGVPRDCAVCAGNTLAIIKAGRLTYFRAFTSVLTAPLIAATLSAIELSAGALPPQICLTGTCRGLADAHTLPLPVVELEMPPELGHLFKNAETFHQLAGLYAVAQACHAGTLPDFRQGELAWTAGDARLRRKLLLTGVLTAVIILLLFTNKGFQYRVAAADIASLNKSIESIYHEIFPARGKAVDEISEIKGEMRKMGGAEISGGYLDILKKLAEAKGNSINSLYEAELEGRSLRIKGDASSVQAVNEFKAAIAPLMAVSELGEVKSRPDGTVTFRITGTLKEVAK